LSLISAATAQTLEDCLAIARTHAPSIRVAEADVSRADEAIREARAALSPTLRLGASLVQSTESPRTVFTIPGTPGGPLAIKIGSATVLDVRTEARMPLRTTWAAIATWCERRKRPRWLARTDASRRTPISRCECPERSIGRCRRSVSNPRRSKPSGLRPSIGPRAPRA
jgi:hypothetical protein